jgi:hypothetical protein
VILRNVVKIEKIEDPIPAVEAIVKKVSREQLLRLYKVCARARVCVCVRAV